MIVVSSSFPVGKMAVHRIPVFILSGGRYAAAILLMIPLLIYSRKAFRSVSNRDIFLLILQAFFGVWVFNISLFWGLKYLPAANSGIILGAVPAMVLLLSRLFYKESLTARKLIGLILAFLAVWLVNSPDAAQTGDLSVDYWLGILFVLVAAIGEALFLFISKTTSTHVSPFISASLISIFGFLMILPLTVWESLTMDFGRLSMQDILLMLYFGVVVTFVGYLLWFRGVSAVPAGVSAYFTSVMPVSAVFLSGILLGESIQMIHYVSLVLIVSAIFISIYQPRAQQA